MNGRTYADWGPFGPVLEMQGALYASGRANRTGRVLKNGECAVALAAAPDHRTAGSLHAFDDDLRVTRNGKRHRLRRVFPEARGAFNIREKKSQVPSRQFSQRRLRTTTPALKQILQADCRLIDPRK